MQPTAKREWKINRKALVLLVFFVLTGLLFYFINSRQNSKVNKQKSPEVLQVSPTSVSAVTLSLSSDKSSLKTGETTNIIVKTTSVPVNYKALGFIVAIKVPKSFEKPTLTSSSFPSFTYNFTYPDTSSYADAVKDKGTYWEVDGLGVRMESNPFNLPNNTPIFSFSTKLISTPKTNAKIEFIKDSGGNYPAVVSSNMTQANLTTTDTTIELNPTAEPTISLTSVTKNVGDANFTIPFSTNSTGAKTFTSSNTSVATITNAGLVTIKSAGTSTITFKVAANSKYTAKSTTATLTVNKANQSPLTLSPTTSQSYGSTRTYTVGGGSGTGAVLDTLKSGSATKVSALRYKANSGTGSYVINVTKAADSNFNAKSQDFTITLEKAEPTISLTSVTKNVGDANFTMTFSTNSTGAKTFTSSNTSVATITNAGLVTIKSAGTSTITFKVAANSKYTAKSTTATLTVNSVNHAPTNISLSSSDIDENKPKGTVIGTLSTTDVDSGDTFTYSIIEGDTSSFILNGNTLKSNAIFDYETKNSYSIKIKSTDQDGLFKEVTFTITVNDLQEIPYGDINGDGNVDSSDLIFMVKVFFEDIKPIAQEKTRLDFNKDGSFTVVDVMELVTYLFK